MAVASPESVHIHLDVPLLRTLALVTMAMTGSTLVCCTVYRETKVYCSVILTDRLIQLNNILFNFYTQTNKRREPIYLISLL